MRHRWDPVAPPVRGLVRPVPVDPSGRDGPTRGQAAGPGWRRTSTGRYVPAGTGCSPEQRILEQSMRIRDAAVMTGWAALRLHGGGFFDGLGPDGCTTLPVPIAANGERLRSSSEVWVSRDLVPPAEVTLRHGIRCAIVERALFDAMGRAEDLREAVVAMDMAAAAELTSIRRMRRYAEARAGVRGRRTVLAALDLADEGSRSPQEVRLRLVWELDAGWGRPLTNRPVLDLEGRLIGVPDLLDPDRGVVGEYDGADHRERARHRRDVRREDLFRRAGLEYVAVVGADLRDRRLVVDRLLAAGARSGRAPRCWRLAPEQPPLDLRLDHRDAMEALARGE